jgi:hypothetical protein
MSYLSSVKVFHENEKVKSGVVRFHSMKNQWLMLIKNEDLANFRRDFPFILSRELMVVGYNAFFSPRTLRAVAEFVRLLPSALAKRRQIKNLQRVSPDELRRWLAPPRSPRAGRAE